MAIKELYEKYGDVELTEEQEKHIKKYLKIKENKKWKPKHNEKYFYITSFGNIYIDNIYNDKDYDDFRLDNNNCFKTEKDAKFRLEQIKVYNELKNFADENNSDIKGFTFLITLQSGDLVANPYSNIHHIGEISFSSRELAFQAIDKVGADRIKKYLFGVE